MAEDANPFRIDVDRIITGGVSAGAISALHATYLDQPSEMPAVLVSDAAALGGIEGNSGSDGYSSDVRACYSFSGAIGDTSWIVPGDQPLVSVHEDADEIVPCWTEEVSVFGIPTGLLASGSGHIHRRAEHTGLQHCFLLYPGNGHVGYLTSDQATSLGVVFTFLSDVVCGNSGRCGLQEEWFCSNPDAALAMVLARIDGAPAGLQGVSLFLLPRKRPDGTANAYRILRLKDKLGTRSMASGEIRLEGAVAYLVGDIHRGFVQMTDMINSSRLSNGVRAAGLMRRGLNEALFVARERMAFGKRLIDLPLMQRQLIKMMVRTEQARTMMFQTAAALQLADSGDPAGRGLVRTMTPLIKFRACRDARTVAGAAMEVRGGEFQKDLYVE